MSEPMIAVEALQQMLGGGGNPLLLDVRTPREFRSHHIDGAVSMPLDRMDPAAVRAGLEGRDGCVLVCLHGSRALRAREVLERDGVSSLSVLDGGMAAWRKAGLPVSGTGGGDLRIVPRIVFAILFGAALVLGNRSDPVFYGFAAFAALGFLAGGLPCCGGGTGGGSCGGGCSCGR